MKEIFSYFELVREQVEKRDAVTISILVSLIVILFTTVLLIVLRSKSNKRRGVLILGICDSGKTLLFSRLVHGKYKETYTSIALNSGLYQLPNNNKSLRIIDLPGHERLRQQSLEQNKNLARSIVFLIDSVNFQKEIKEVAEYLYTVLSDKVISANAPPVLIACNKQDHALAKGHKVIQSQLEEEMNTLRVTKSAALPGLDSSSNNTAFLGKRNKDFEFVDLKSFKVQFVECSLTGKTKEEEPDLKQIVNWLCKIA